MVRAAAKNHPSVAVVVDPASYPAVIAAVAAGGFTLAAAAAARGAGVRSTPRPTTSRSRSWMGSVLAPTDDGTGFPAWTGATWDRAAVSALRREPAPAGGALPARARVASPAAEQLHGPELSYNNYVDTDAARRAAYDFEEPVRRDHQARQPVRHRGRQRHRRGAPARPRVRPGLGVRRGHRGQPHRDRGAGRAARRSADRGDLRAGYDDGRARDLPRKNKLRVLRVRRPTPHRDPVEFRPISGGLLMQTVDRRRRGRRRPGDVDACRPARRPTPRRSPTWRSPGGPAASVKSNAILLAIGGATVGVGMGQVNRVDSARLAVSRAGDRAKGSVGGERRVLPVPRRARRC